MSRRSDGSTLSRLGNRMNYDDYKQWLMLNEKKINLSDYII